MSLDVVRLFRMVHANTRSHGISSSNAILSSSSSKQNRRPTGATRKIRGDPAGHNNLSIPLFAGEGLAGVLAPFRGVDRSLFCKRSLRDCAILKEIAVHNQPNSLR